MLKSSQHSIQSPSNEKINYRQKGRSPEGKITKGPLIEASQKVVVSSIPSKSETIVYKSSNIKGFGSSQFRFSSLEDDDLPGPGYYVQPAATSVQNYSFPEKETLSTKQLRNGFMSASPRPMLSARNINKGPGPGAYTNNLIPIDRNNSLSSPSKGSSMFLSKPRNEQTERNRIQSVDLPGPSDYEPKIAPHNSSNAYHSSFLTKTNREKYLGLNENPGIGQYYLKRELLKQNHFIHNGPTSSFCKNVEKHQKSDYKKELISFLSDGSSTSRLNVGSNQPIPIIVSQMPGPTTYSPKPVKFRPDYLNKKTSFSFIEGQKDRFGDFIDKSKEKEPLPGPFSYRRDEYGFTKLGEAHSPVSSSMFTSGIDRNLFKESESKLGPSGHLSKRPPQKVSFHLNIKRMFI